MRSHPKKTGLSYRAEVDGLRAVAVTSVILYHAQFTAFGLSLIEGGFIGVDIFFVISGYLITRIILHEIKQRNSFSFSGFYQRRARRILPMLFAVIFFSLPFAWNMLLPSDFEEYAESILASLLFGSNFYFYATTTEYVATSALLKPFLHTWSLSVEEQFYLAFPILSIVSFRYLRRYFLALLVGLFFLSLFFSAYMEMHHPELNFYFSISRFWELATGSILAFIELENRLTFKNSSVRILPILGLFLILYSVFTFTNETPHPSFPTLLPVAGTAMVIAFSSMSEPVGRLLGSRPLVWLGLISYSAYLWHFPIFAFSRIEGEPDNLFKALLIFILLLLSVASFLLIEQPFRRTVSRRIFLVAILTCTIILSTAVTASIYSRGFSQRYQYDFNFSLDRRRYGEEHIKFAREINNKLPFDEESINLLLVGNSHARDLQSAFYQNKNSLDGFKLKRYMSVGQISCFDPKDQDQDIKNLVADFFRSEDYMLSSVVIVSTWFQEKQACGEKVLDDFTGLSALIGRVLLDGKRIIVFGQNAEFKPKNLNLLNHRIQELAEASGGMENIQLDDFNKTIEALEYETYKTIDPLVKEKVIKAEEIAKKFGVPFVDKYSLSCSDLTKKCLVLTPDGDRVFWDNHHFTLSGARYIGSRLLTEEFIALLKDSELGD